MPNYIIAYMEGKQPETPEQGQKQKEGWQKWMHDLGSAIINPGTPLAKTHTVSAGGAISGGHMTGFSIVKAENIEAALEIAKACPYTDIGTVEVSEIMEMKP